MIEDLDEPFLAMNGDVLTTLDFAQLMRFHRGHEGGARRSRPTARTSTSTSA